MNNVYTFGDLKIVTSDTIKTDQQYYTIGCSPSEVSMSYGSPKTLYVPGRGSWTHIVLIWFGDLTEAFKTFTRALHKSTKVYSNDHVNVWLLKNNKALGTLEVSVYITPQGYLRINNHLGNQLLKSLDKMYNTYKYTKSIDHAIKVFFGVPNHVSLTDDSQASVAARVLIYTRYVEPLVLNQEEEAQKYEDYIAMAFDISRKDTIRQLLLAMYKRGCELEKQFGH